MKIRTAAVVALPVLAAAAWLYAGPLNPPSGPIASTGKSLTEVEPRIAINSTNTPGDADSLYKIVNPGSYYVPGNITGVSGKFGVEIAANGVTLDLAGFELLGVPGSLNAIAATVAVKNVAVVNGSVRSWADSGVLLFNASASRVEGVRASSNSGTGIVVGNTCSVVGCLTWGNSQSGVSTGYGSSVDGCNATNNNGYGLLIGDGCMVSACSASTNTFDGILCGSGCALTRCTGHGNAGSGITLSSGTTATNCSAYSNTIDGIQGLGGNNIAGCTAFANVGDGIQCGSACLISGNSCTNNGSGAGDGAGIHATGNDNRIEGNNCVGADCGIDVDGSGNIIIRNTCSGNGVTWTIVANNYYGPIIARTGVATAAVTGETATSVLASTDPHANFTY